MLASHLAGLLSVCGMWLAKLVAGQCGLNVALCWLTLSWPASWLCGWLSLCVAAAWPRLCAVSGWL